MSNELLAFVNPDGYEYRVVHEGVQVKLLHRPAERFRAPMHRDRWHEGVKLTLSSVAAQLPEMPMLGARMIRSYMLRAINHREFMEMSAVLTEES
jgi:hypothetical protein